jgi:hypothetical protein
VAQALAFFQGIFAQGHMSAAEFGDVLARSFLFRDGAGGLWSPGVEAGRWFRLERGRWIEAPPPAVLLAADATGPSGARPASGPAAAPRPAAPPEASAARQAPPRAAPPVAPPGAGPAPPAAARPQAPPAEPHVPPPPRRDAAPAAAPSHGGRPAPAQERPRTGPAVGLETLDREGMLELAAILADAQQSGRLGADEFKKLYGAFVAIDANGGRWTVDLRTGQWQRAADGRWTPDDPPLTIRLAAQTAKRIAALRPQPAPAMSPPAHVPPSRPTGDRDRQPRAGPGAASFSGGTHRRRCPGCGWVADADVPFCGRCGTAMRGGGRVNDASARVAGAGDLRFEQTASAAQARQCPQCGAVPGPGAKFCGSCGTAF